MLDYFRHPFLPRKDERPHTTQELFRVYEDARTAQKLCDILQPLVARRKGDVDYLRYCARMHEHYVESQRLVADLNAATTEGLSPEAIEKTKSRFLARIVKVRDETVSLRDMFKELWLRTNVPANLHYAIDEYNALVKVWDDAAARAKQGDFAYDPRPKSAWIYHPDATNDKPVQHAYFRQMLSLDPARGRLGRHSGAGRHARENLRQRRRNRRAVRPAKSFRAGQSQAAGRLRHQAASPAGRERDRRRRPAPTARSAPSSSPAAHRSGGFYLYGELRDKSGKATPILSDASWKVSTKAGPKWNQPGLDASTWPAAKSDPKPTVWVTYPDLEKGLRGFSDLR